MHAVILVFADLIGVIHDLTRFGRMTRYRPLRVHQEVVNILENTQFILLHYTQVDHQEQSLLVTATSSCALRSSLLTQSVYEHKKVFDRLVLHFVRHTSPITLCS